MYLWDTNIAVHYANQHPAILSHIQRVEWHEIALPSPTVAELLRGRGEFALKATPEQVVQAHHQLWQTQQLIARFRQLLIDDDAATVFKKLLGQIKSKKRYADIMIAAMALAGNHVVVTRNTKHFKDLLPPDQLANWIDEPPQ
jgi:predicted nucleic acid-binding protein